MEWCHVKDWAKTNVNREISESTNKITCEVRTVEFDSVFAYAESEREENSRKNW